MKHQLSDARRQIPDARRDPLLDPQTLRQYLKGHHLPPLERFGQHFLTDPDVLERIVAAADPDPAVPTIEIGAGLGVLTSALANWKLGTRNWELDHAPLIAVEIDRRLIPLLRERVREFPFVHVVQGDILKLSRASFAQTSISHLPTPYDVVGNIPYNITAKLLRHVVAWSPRPRRVTFLVDAAVAARIAAVPPDMSVLAIAVQVFAAPQIIGATIPPSAFVPPPAVSSAILRLAVRPAPLVPAADQDAFFRLVRAGFAQKRKMLQNALRALWRCAPADAAARLTRAGIKPSRRAQTLTIAEWKAILK